MEDEPIRTSEFLSQMLASCIDDLDFESGHEAKDELEYKEAREFMDRAIRLAASSLEGVAESAGNKLIELLQQDRDHWQWRIDDFYGREVVRKIPGMVNRFLRLAPVLVGVIPSREVQIYLREATRCFIYGFFQASIALCRAALEAGLNEHLERRLGRVPAQDLVDKIDAAQRLQLISGQGAHSAHEVRKTARNVLHRKPAKTNLAFDTLVQTRGFLQELYER